MIEAIDLEAGLGELQDFVDSIHFDEDIPEYTRLPANDEDPDE